MSIRKSSATVPVDQPVRFYKIVALSFLCLTIALLSVIVFMSTKRATITIYAKEQPLSIEKTVTVGETSDMAMMGRIELVPITLSQTFSPTGTKQEEGLATGRVTIVNESALGQSLIPTTRLLTPEGILFRLKDRVTVPPGGSVSAEVYADAPGTAFDVGPVDRFTIPGLSADKQSVIYAQSTEPMRGGVRTIGTVQPADIDRAKAILEEVALEEAHASSTISTGLLDRRLLLLDPVYTLPTIDPLVEVDAFTVELTGVVAVILYDPADTHRIAEEEIQKRTMNATELVALVEGQEIMVRAVSVDTERKTATLEVSFSALATLNPHSDPFQKTQFLGKTREDIRRTLLSLDHVDRVDIDVSPPWIRTIPFVPDHVQLTIRTEG